MEVSCPDQEGRRGSEEVVPDNFGVPHERLQSQFPMTDRTEFIPTSSSSRAGRS